MIPDLLNCLTVERLKNGVNQRIATKEYGSQTVNAPEIKDYLERKGQQFGVIPETFQTPQELLKSLGEQIMLLSWNLISSV